MTNEDLWGLVRVEEHHVLRHRVLDEEVLEVPETEVGDLGNLAVSNHQHVAGLEVPVHNGAPQIVEIAQTLAETLSRLINNVFYTFAIPTAILILSSGLLSAGHRLGFFINVSKSDPSIYSRICGRTRLYNSLGIQQPTTHISFRKSS